jgi:PAS domain S-box-containing protein
VENPVDRALREGVIVGLANHTILVARDGTEHFIDDSAAPIRARDDRVTGCVLVFRDIGEQKAQERTTARSEARFRMLSENIAPLTWIAESDGTRPWYSKRWHDYTGTTPDAMGTEGAPTVLHPDHADRVREGYRAAVRSESAWEDVFPIRGATGEYRWFLSRAVPIRGHDGQVANWIGSNTDITDERAAADALRLSDLRFRKALEAVNSLIWTNDASGKMVGDQPWWSAFTGQSYDEYQGYGWSSAVHPDDAQPTIDAWDVAVATQSPFIFEHRVRRRDGEWRVCTIRAIPVIRSDGAVHEWVGVHTDVTDVRAAAAREQQLIADVSLADAKFRALFDQGAHLAALMEPDGTIIEPNRHALAASGLSRDRIVGRKFWAGEWWGDSTETRDAVRRATERSAAGDVVRFEVPFVTTSGTRRVVDLIIVPIRNETGQVIFLAPTATDITGRAETQAQLQRSEEELRRIASALSEADHRKDEFLATLAHELRNPLAPIRNGLQIMRVAADDRAVMERTQSMIERQIDHLVQLVDDLMDISRISRGTIALREESLDLAAVLRHAVETSRPLIDQKAQALEIEPVVQPMPVFGDRTRLTQIFANLLNNASRYTERGGTISLHSAVQGNVVEVRIRDSGIGIPPEMLAEIFEMFAQVDRSLERSQSGLGIGLTLVKRLVEMHHGTVTATSDGLGHGSEFVVRIPLSNHSQQPTRTAVPAIPAVLRPLRVLVVDDNVDSAQSLASLLSILGHDVRRAHDGLEALSAAESFRPQVVLLDIGMPRLNGYEACRALRARPWAQSIHIIALTGWGQPDDRQRSLDAGFDRHLVKPVDPAALHAILNVVEDVKAD